MLNVNFQEKHAPIYFQLTQSFKKYILKELKPGDRFPSERELAGRFKVSTITVSRALGELVHEGLLYRIQGKGTFISDRFSRKAVVSLKKLKTIGLFSCFNKKFIRSDPFYISLLGGIQGKDCRVLLYSLSELQCDIFSWKDLFSRNLLDGIILEGVSSSINNRRVMFLKKEGIPFVLLGRSPIVNTAIVDIDNIKGAFMATDHLICLGHRSVGLVCGPFSYSVTQERIKGYRLALKEHRLRYSKTLIRESDFTEEDSYRRTKELIELPVRPTAIFVTHGCIVSGAIRAIKEEKLSIPAEMAVVVYDDYPIFSYMDPPLTAVSQPVYDFGNTAAEMLLKIIDGKQLKSMRVILEPKLIVRKSCGSFGN